MTGARTSVDLVKPLLASGLRYGGLSLPGDIRRTLDAYDALARDLLASRTWRIGHALVDPPARALRRLMGRPVSPGPLPRLEKIRSEADRRELSEASRRTLELLRRVLTDSVHGDPFRPYVPDPGSEAAAGWKRLREQFPHDNVELVRRVGWDERRRAVGNDWPSRAESMVGLARLENFQDCIESVHMDAVPGDIVETGVWRGGASIFARAVLRELEVPDRLVWVCDSFEGLPPPDPDQWPEDEGDVHYLREELAVSVDEVKANFERYGLLDDQVRFVEGWFEDTLADLPTSQIAVLRLDGDMYGSTMVALDALEHRVPPGGYVIIDDFGAIPQCRKAVEDYRRAHGITAEIVEIDWTGAYWRKP